MIFSFNAKPDIYVTTKIGTNTEQHWDCRTMGHHHLWWSTSLIISVCAGGIGGLGNGDVLKVDLDMLNVS